VFSATLIFSLLETAKALDVRIESDVETRLLESANAASQPRALWCVRGCDYTNGVSYGERSRPQ
jgi:uncharacterized membrane protein